MSKRRGRSESIDSEDKENDLNKRLKRLEELFLRKDKKKEKKRRRHRRGSGHSRDSSDSPRSYEGRRSETLRQSVVSHGSRDSDREKDPEHDRQSDAAENVEIDETASNRPEQQDEAPAMQVADNIPQADRPIPAQAPETQGDSGDIVLDPKILEVMGKRFIEDRILTAAISNDLGIRWEEILKNGMPTEDSVALIKKYPPPRNCCIIDPPKVNPEVRASLQEAIIKRDERIEAKQAKIAAGLAAVGKTFSKMLERHSGPEDLDIFEQLSDIGRLLADLQHDESSIRKNLILANLSVPFKDVLSESAPDEMLFGNQLEEKLKAAKALENCKKDFKATLKPQNSNGSKNSKFPPRRPQGNQRQASSAPGGKKQQNTRTQHALTNRRGNQKYGSNWKTSQRYDNQRQKRY